MTDRLIVDLDADGKPIGVEVLGVRQLLNPEDLARVTVENLLATPTGTSGAG